MMTTISSGGARPRLSTSGDGDHGGRGLRPVGAWTVAETRAAGMPALAALAAWARNPYALRRG